MTDDQRDEQPGDERPARGPFGLPAPSRGTVVRSAAVTGVGAAMVFLGVLLLQFVVCADGTCPPGPLRTFAEGIAVVGFLVVLVAASYGATASLHVRRTSDD